MHLSCSDEPKFTINGTIRDTTGLFFIPPEEAAKKLAKEIEKKSYIMLQGHRGSGKVYSTYIQHIYLFLLTILLSLHWPLTQSLITASS